MTYVAVRWTRVLFGVGLTLVVAMAPMFYVLVTGPSPDGRTRAVQSDEQALGLASSGFNIPDHQGMIFFVASTAIVAVLSVVAATARSQSIDS